eukprot:CAMPEP_0194086138 /NCGR_PEP_ID=MMETSP0149-20130528/20157_1 /TAXON_ID=122233 /ORGANISM="Chaetoceros debilis, Strain MM31A-1" /LENGTH=242 /DNA_ID=CAMNT_0038769169 /DNA_START=184 /DNA_END=909 /DNA_ORIENTATION=+
MAVRKITNTNKTKHAVVSSKRPPKVKSKRYEENSASKMNSNSIPEILPQRPQQKLKKTHHENGAATYKMQCWAHTKKGIRCCKLVSPREGEPVPIPYCDVHLKSGDGALKIAKHPIAGKCLVARFDLPAKYRVVFWGKRGPCPPCDKEDRAISFYPPDKVSGKNINIDGSKKTNNYNGVLNPGDTADMMQYAQCPGPNERQNMKSTFQYWGVRNGELGGSEFITSEKVPAGAQLCIWYGPGW